MQARLMILRRTFWTSRYAGTPMSPDVTRFTLLNDKRHDDLLIQAAAVDVDDEALSLTVMTIREY